MGIEQVGGDRRPCLQQLSQCTCYILRSKQVQTFKVTVTFKGLNVIGIGATR